MTVEKCEASSVWFVRPLVVEGSIATFANRLKVLIPAEAPQSYVAPSAFSSHL